jgi:hypothetical protein
VEPEGRRARADADARRQASEAAASHPAPAEAVSMSEFDITIVLTSNTDDPRTLTLQPATDDERQELLEQISQAVSNGLALRVNAKNRQSSIIVNPAHIVYAE